LAHRYCIGQALHEQEIAVRLQPTHQQPTTAVGSTRCSKTSVKTTASNIP
jgi:hypothetical protein